MLTKNNPHVFRYFEKQADTLGQLIEKARRAPSRKAVHDLRIATRRTRASLWILRHNPAPLRFRKLNRDLKALGQALGQARECDVAIQDAERFHLNQSRLRADSNKDVEPRLAAETLYRRISPWQRRAIRSDRSLHEFRIEIKKLRYFLEAIGRPVKPLRELQRVLGQAHDLEVLEELAGKNSRVERARTSLSRRSTRLSKPALRFGMNQLDFIRTGKSGTQIV